MILAIWIVSLFMLWVITLAIAFAGGYFYKRSSRPKVTAVPLTAEEQRRMRREQKELENFMNYDGTRQDDIS